MTNNGYQRIRRLFKTSSDDSLFLDNENTSMKLIMKVTMKSDEYTTDTANKTEYDSDDDVSYNETEYDSDGCIQNARVKNTLLC